MTFYGGITEEVVMVTCIHITSRYLILSFIRKAAVDVQSTTTPTIRFIVSLFLQTAIITSSSLDPCEILHSQ